MPHSSSIPRTPSQTAFDRVCDIYGNVSDVAKGDKRATAVLVDYFKSQPQDARVAKGRELMAQARKLPDPARRVGPAIVHSVSGGLAKTSQVWSQARKLIDKLCIEHEIKRFQEELERGFAYHGTTLRQAAKAAEPILRAAQMRVLEMQGQSPEDAPQPRCNPDLAAVLRDSTILDEVVLAVVERMPLDRINACLSAYSDELGRLSDRLHALKNDLARIHVAVGPRGEVPALSEAEGQAYAQLLAWAEVVHPGLHSRLQRLNDTPEAVRAHVSPEQLSAFVSLGKRAALSVVQKAFSPRELTKLQAFYSSPVGQELGLLAREFEWDSQAAVMHVGAPLMAMLATVAQASGKDATVDGKQPLPFRDASAQPRGSEDNMEAEPFGDLP